MNDLQLVVVQLQFNNVVPMHTTFKKLIKSGISVDLSNTTRMHTFLEESDLSICCFLFDSVRADLLESLRELETTLLCDMIPCIVEASHTLTITPRALYNRLKSVGDGQPTFLKRMLHKHFSLIRAVYHARNLTIDRIQDFTDFAQERRMFCNVYRDTTDSSSFSLDKHLKLETDTSSKSYSTKFRIHICGARVSPMHEGVVTDMLTYSDVKGLYEYNSGESTPLSRCCFIVVEPTQTDPAQLLCETLNLLNLHPDYTWSTLHGLQIEKLGLDYTYLVLG